MIRILIDWDYLSPTLGIASGICTVAEVNFMGSPIKNEQILRFKVKVERGSIGFTGMVEREGIPTKEFEKYSLPRFQLKVSYVEVQGSRFKVQSSKFRVQG